MSAPAVPDPDAVDAVAVLMTEVSEGRLTAAMMADRAAQRCREVFGTCDGPSDPLWNAHVDICRAVLGHGGLSASELAQWLSVARSRENPSRTGDYPPAPVSPGSEAHSPENEAADAADDDETIEVPDALADQIKTLVDTYWQEHPREDEIR